MLPMTPQCMRMMMMQLIFINLYFLHFLQLNFEVKEMTTLSLQIMLMLMMTVELQSLPP